MPLLSDSGDSRICLLGRSGFFAAALAERLNPWLGSRLHIIGSAELDLTAPGAGESLATVVDERTVLIVTARARASADSFRTFTDDVAIAANVARCVATGRLRRCVYFSSTAIYGDATSNRTITEQTPLAPTSLYGTSKVAAEGVLRHAAERAGVPLVVLRPCMVYGPGDPSTPYGPGRFLSSVLREGQVRVFGDGRELRDYLFIRDLVEITLALALGDTPGAYNLASGTSHSFQHILAHLAEIVGSPFEVVTVPRDRSPTDQGFDISRLRTALPNLELTPLEVGLTETATACRARTGRT